MRLHRVLIPGVLSVTFALGAQAQNAEPAPEDSVVISVTSPRGAEVLFSGEIRLADNSRMRLDHIRTPYQLRVAYQPVEATFRSDDGGKLSGELRINRIGKQPGGASGTGIGRVHLFLDPGREYGYGARTRP